MALLGSERVQRRLIDWQIRRGAGRVIVGITAVSVVSSMLIAYPVMILSYGNLGSTGLTGVLLPIVIPLTVAPFATDQIIQILRRSNELVEELTATRERLSVEIERSAAAQAELEKLSNHDPLTGVLNRRGFYDAVARDPRISESGATVVVVDVDRFKSVNDEHGHAVGDRLLAEVAEQLRGLDGDPLVARLGGDEFVVVRHCDDDSDLGDGQRTVSIPSGGRTLHVTFSVGAATHDPATSIDTTILLADRSLYAVKARAGGRPDAPLRSAADAAEVLPSPR